MRLRTSMALLLITAAGLTVLALAKIKFAAPPATERALLVIEDTAPAPYDCPYV